MEGFPVLNQTSCVDRLVLDSDDAGSLKTRSSNLPTKLRDEVEEIISYVEETLRNDTDFVGSSTKESVYQNQISPRPSSSSSSNLVYGTLLTPVSARHVKTSLSLNCSEPSRPDTADSGKPESEYSHTRPLFRDNVVGKTTNDREQEPNLDKVTINVGGQRFTTLKSTLKNVSHTRLSNLSEQDMFFDRKNNEYFFDRNPRCFESILDFYRTGNLHFMHCLCGPSIKQELDFWQINENFIAPCCWRSYKAYENDQETLKVLDKALEEQPRDQTNKQSAVCNKVTCQWRLKIWTFIDNPFSSKAAQVWAVFVFLLILMSLVNVCLETHPYFRVPRSVESLAASMLELNTSNPKRIMYHVTLPHPTLWYIEAAMVFIFNGELLIRSMCCPNKLRFFKSVFNIIDIFCVIPMLIVFLMELFDPLFWDSQHFYIIITYISSTSVLRVFRLFKLARHYKSLKILQLAVKSSLRELLLLFLLITMGMVVFSTLIYFAEFQEDDNFEHIPIGFWWSIVTMTTVGYGDIHPQSGPGYFVGAICTIAGMLATGLPIPIIASNFNHYYSFARFKAKLRQRSMKKRESGLQLHLSHSKNAEFCQTTKNQNKSCTMCGSHRVIKSLPKPLNNRVIPKIRLENT